MKSTDSFTVTANCGTIFRAEFHDMIEGEEHWKLKITASKVTGEFVLPKDWSRPTVFQFIDGLMTNYYL